jgi:hypothetical protein
MLKTVSTGFKQTKIPSHLAALKSDVATYFSKSTINDFFKPGHAKQFNFRKNILRWVQPHTRVWSRERSIEAKVFFNAYVQTSIDWV